MNAAARVLNESLGLALNPAQARRMMLSRQMMLMLCLIGLIIISALCSITIADKNRIEVGTTAALSQQRNDLMTRYNQLLLEENTWAAPARVETIAERNFNMSTPDPKKVIMIQP